MITFGLTGGIACGKSTVTKTFRTHGIHIVDADIVARQVVESGTPGLHKIVDTFGTKYLTNGVLNREALGKLVFSDEESMSKLNNIMKPLIHDEADKQIKQAHANGYKLVGYDAALIIEQGDAWKYRPLIVVSCPKDMQLQRLMQRNSLTREDAMARIESQIPVEMKVLIANYVIDTSGTIEESIKQTEEIIQKLKS